MYDDGIDLSGGQLQKIALARTLYGNKPLLIFDEPSSAQDIVSEYRFFNMLFNKKEQTLILISHHLSNITAVDRIVFLEGGKVCGYGTHDTLIRNNTQYRYLYDMQNKLHKQTKDI